MTTRIVAPLLASTVLVSCGNDPKAPSKANFLPVIRAEIEKNNPYCEVVLKGQFMYAIPASPLQTALTKRGLLIPYSRYPPGTGWIVSPEGMKLGPRQNRNVGDFIACLAEGAEVAEIVKWTEPENLLGIIMTNVTYTIKPTKVAAWVTPDLAPLIPQLRDAHKRTIDLQLTGEGWETALL
jgi:hypothetical protein